jgi:hypothetical protein
MDLLGASKSLIRAFYVSLEFEIYLRLCEISQCGAIRLNVIQSSVVLYLVITTYITTQMLMC